jgi:peptidoglycan/LPS O-acetylase OafA/YrhL
MAATATTSEPRARLAHQPSLDGIRALAVAAVILFHAGNVFATGGFIGVDIFLVLSGFLITTLLLRELHATGGVAFKDFWLRRARRLLPALFLVLLAVAVFGAFVAADDEVRGLRGDLVGSLFYVQNWRLVISGQSYFAKFGSPSPLRHMWSLAIEEQWYLIWPLLLSVVVTVTRRNYRLVLATILGLAAASALLMAALYHPGGDASRVYYGTDTRAQALLLGAALAVLFLLRSLPRTRVARVAIQLLGIAGGIFLAWVVIEQSEHWTTLYRGGFTLVALAAAALIAAAMQPGPVRTVLSVQPLPAIGLISYGLYLWHWPIFVMLSPDRTGLSGHRLLAARLVVTFAVSIASFVLVERPIRAQRLRWVRRRVAWIPVTCGVTLVAMIALTASGAAAKPPPELTPVERFTKALNAPPPPGATRVLIAGDSIAVTLGFDGVPPDQRKRIWLKGVARVGCGLLAGTLVFAGDVRGDTQDACASWPRDWQAGVRRYSPQVAVVLVGGWEVFDREVDGKFLRVGTDAMEEQLRHALDTARRVLTARGAHMVILTTPCFSPTDRELGDAAESERADPARVDWLNAVWRRYATDHPDVTLLDLDAHACPGGRYADTIHGVKMRTDGVHFTLPGARLMWRWLGPKVVQIAHGPQQTTP